MDLKSTVANLLVTKYDFSLEDAEEAVDDSSSDTNLWHENSDAEKLAEFLASDEADE